MVILNLIEKNNSYVRYNFIPEDKYAEGIVQLDITNGDISVIKESPYERVNLYMGQVFSALRKMYREKEYPNQASRIWW